MQAVSFIEPPQADVIEDILKHCSLWQSSTARKHLMRKAWSSNWMPPTRPARSIHLIQPTSPRS